MKTIEVQLIEPNEVSQLSYEQLGTCNKSLEDAIEQLHEIKKSVNSQLVLKGVKEKNDWLANYLSKNIVGKNFLLKVDGNLFLSHVINIHMDRESLARIAFLLKKISIYKTDEDESIKFSFEWEEFWVQNRNSEEIISHVEQCFLGKETTETFELFIAAHLPDFMKNVFNNPNAILKDSTEHRLSDEYSLLKKPNS